jgi:hypothetical protein
LRIYPNDGFERPPDISRINWQIGHFPYIVIGFGKRIHAFADSVLMASRKGGMNKLASIGVALMNQKLVTEFGGFDQPVDIGKIQMWVNALGKHIQPKGDQINIAGTLAIAKQSAFDTVGTCHQAKFGCGDGAAAVIMRVEATKSPNLDWKN